MRSRVIVEARRGKKDELHFHLNFLVSDDRVGVFRATRITTREVALREIGEIGWKLIFAILRCEGIQSLLISANHITIFRNRAFNWMAIKNHVLQTLKEFCELENVSVRYSDLLTFWVVLTH